MQEKIKGIIDNENVIKAGNGAVLADEINLKKIELLAERLGVKVFTKQVVYIPTW